MQKITAIRYFSVSQCATVGWARPGELKSTIFPPFFLNFSTSLMKKNFTLKPTQGGGFFRLFSFFGGEHTTGRAASPVKQSCRAP